MLFDNRCTYASLMLLPFGLWAPDVAKLYILSLLFGYSSVTARRLEKPGVTHGNDLRDFHSP